MNSTPNTFLEGHTREEWDRLLSEMNQPAQRKPSLLPIISMMATPQPAGVKPKPPGDHLTRLAALWEKRYPFMRKSK